MVFELIHVLKVTFIVLGIAGVMGIGHAVGKELLGDTPKIQQVLHHCITLFGVISAIVIVFG